MTPKTFLFIGRSGAGKGTQAKLLAEHLKGLDASTPVYYLETGAHFRTFIQGDSYTSLRAKTMYNRAERMPDFLAIWNWSDLLVNYFTDAMHLIMDGMPRSLNEAMMLRTALDFYAISELNVVYVRVTPEWAKLRLKERHRFDDKTEAELEKKVSWFNQDVVPAIEYFKNDPFYHYIELNGEQTIDDVFQELLSKIK